MMWCRRSKSSERRNVSVASRPLVLLALIHSSAWKGNSANFARTCSEVGLDPQRKNSTGAIHSRLTKAIAKHTSKAIDSKVRYDSWLLTWMKSTLDETQKPDRISAATKRTDPTSK